MQSIFLIADLSGEEPTDPADVKILLAYLYNGIGRKLPEHGIPVIWVTLDKGCDRAIYVEDKYAGDVMQAARETRGLRAEYDNSFSLD